MKIYLVLSILMFSFGCTTREANRQVIDIEQLIRERDSLQKRLEFIEKENHNLKNRY